MLHLLLADSYSFWLPEQASTIAPASDALFWFVLWINVFFSSLIMAGLIYFVIKYRHRGNRPHDPTAGHSTALELTWTIIPTLLTLVIFYYGFHGYLHANVMPPNADQVTATGKMWNWSFSYQSSGLSNEPELHVVKDRPVLVTLESNDVIHDLDIPAFRMKKDAVPGRYNRMWFEPTKAGKYEVYCAMYCGTGHSIMRATCVVHATQAEFDAWMKDKLNWKGKISPIQRGHDLYSTVGCATCHNVTGATGGTGPTWKDMFGSIVPLADGTTVLADEAYVKESILQPQAKIVRGYGPPSPMPPFQFNDDDISALTWYMKSISRNFKGDLTPGKSVTPVVAVPGNPVPPPVTQPAAVPGRPPNDFPAQLPQGK